MPSRKEATTQAPDHAVYTLESTRERIATLERQLATEPTTRTAEEQVWLWQQLHAVREEIDAIERSRSAQ